MSPPCLETCVLIKLTWPCAAWCISQKVVRNATNWCTNTAYTYQDRSSDEKKKFTKAWKCNFHRKFPMNHLSSYELSYEIVIFPMKFHRKLHRKIALPGFRRNCPRAFQFFFRFFPLKCQKTKDFLCQNVLISYGL